MERYVRPQLSKRLRDNRSKVEHPKDGLTVPYSS